MCVSVCTENYTSTQSSPCHKTGGLGALSNTSVSSKSEYAGHRRTGCAGNGMRHRRRKRRGRWREGQHGGPLPSRFGSTNLRGSISETDHCSLRCFLTCASWVVESGGVGCCSAALLASSARTPLGRIVALSSCLGGHDRTARRTGRPRDYYTKHRACELSSSKLMQHW